MSGLQVQVLNAGDILGKVSRLPEVVIEAARVAITDEANKIFEQTQIEVPVEKGWLKESGRVEAADLSRGELTVDIAYGDERVDYALIVHEDLMAHHEPPTKAKFVEDPARAEFESGRAVARIAAEVRSAIEKAV